MSEKLNTPPRIWVDLTDMLVWSGHVTGIQRVVYEYAKRFESDEANFFAYDKIGKRFIELGLDQLKLGEATTSHSKDGERSHVTVRRRIRHAVGKPYYLLGDKQKAVLRPLVDATNFYVRYFISKVETKKHDAASPYAKHKEASFKEDDTVILLGASWNDDHVLDQLIDIKREVDFRLVQHINDLLPIYQPQLFSEELPGKFRPYINKVIHNADIVTVISAATKRDVLAYCKENKVSGVRVEILRLGEDIEAEKPLRPETVPVDRSFILAVGTFEVRKNYILLYQAVKLAQLEKRTFPHIVIAGRRGWLTDNLIHMLSLDPYAKENVTWLPNTSDNELNWLYENCMFTVFPSLAEGWGLPIVESLQHGKMSLASGVSSMLEIGDGLVDYFLPYDARECMEKIIYYATDDRYVAFNTKVRDNYSTYTWDESFRSLKSILK